MDSTVVTCANCNKRESVPGRRWCLSCLSYSKEAKAKFRSKPKTPGLCTHTDCPRPASSGYRSCEECRIKIQEYENKNRTKLQFKARENRRRLRMQVFAAYGGAFCACCKEDNYEFLTMDHIDGSGAEHRRQLGNVDIYLFLKKNNFPEGFRVLCMNCNFALGYHGYCPHHGWVQPTNNGRLGRPQKVKEELS